jgi:formiminotetrahydrofolate cyclodeaminase
MADDRLPYEGSIPDLLAALASPRDVHGAVSAAAVAGAMGASLLQMVATLPRSVPDAADGQAALVNANEALGLVREELLETIETETAVRVFAARKLPQASEAERAQREDVLQFALRAAAEVPLEVMRLTTRGLQGAEIVAGRTRRAAAADVELAVALLEAAFQGARANLDARLPSLTDAVGVRSIAEQVARLMHDASAAADAARSLVHVPPA